MSDVHKTDTWYEQPISSESLELIVMNIEIAFYIVSHAVVNLSVWNHKFNSIDFWFYENVFVFNKESLLVLLSLYRTSNAHFSATFEFKLVS